ncbi:hypothetical protein BC332_29091 [Capsicum chinense]|nr:hypothetical protein BC332_29091 [Capsicum chinense]
MHEGCGEVWEEGEALSQGPLKLNCLSSDARISSTEYSEKVMKEEEYVSVDVQPAHHYKIGLLPNSMNIPLSTWKDRFPEISVALEKEAKKKTPKSYSSTSLFVICRRGNDLQRVIELLYKLEFSSAKDMIGGLKSWAHNVDPKFPTY